MKAKLGPQEVSKHFQHIYIYRLATKAEVRRI